MKARVVEGSESTQHDLPLLYNVNVDPEEKYNIADEHPEVISEIKDILEEHRKSINPVENQMKK